MDTVLYLLKILFGKYITVYCASFDTFDVKYCSALVQYNIIDLNFAQSSLSKYKKIYNYILIQLNFMRPKMSAYDFIDKKVYGHIRV